MDIEDLLDRILPIEKILGLIWIISWVCAIWIYHIQFFLTGLFCLFLVVLILGFFDKKEEEMLKLPIVFSMDENTQTLTVQKIYDKYTSLKYLSIDSSRYSDGIDAVSVSSDIDTASPAEVGKGIQKLIEKVVFSLGENAGRNFIKRLKKRLGKAYLLRIEEMGVNLYMMELRHNLMW